MIDYFELGALALAVFFMGILYLLKKKNVDFGIRTILAVGLGIIVGISFKGSYTYYSIFGTIYTRLISAVVAPLLLFSIISSITNLGSEVRLKKIGLKSITFLFINTLCASVITLLAAAAVNIGRGFQFELPADYKGAEVPSIMNAVTSLIPSNLAEHWVNNEVVPIVIFAVITAVAYNKLAGEKTEGISAFKNIIDAGNKVMGRVTGFIIELTPYAVLALIGKAVSQNELSDLLPLLGVLVFVYIISAVQIFGVESLLLIVIGKMNPVKFFKGIFPAAAVAFTSQSSIGTIPVTTKQLTKKLDVDEDIAVFTTTLGANIGMPGCAGMWPVLLAVFAINILGIDYSVSQYIFLIVLALVVAVGTVGVPGTAAIAATAVFVAAGLPVEVIVLLSPISSIADMARTATNVIGAATAAVLVDRTEKKRERIVMPDLCQVNKKKQPDTL